MTISNDTAIIHGVLIGQVIDVCEGCQSLYTYRWNIVVGNYLSFKLICIFNCFTNLIKSLTRILFLYLEICRGLPKIRWIILETCWASEIDIHIHTCRIEVSIECLVTLLCLSDYAQQIYVNYSLMKYATSTKSHWCRISQNMGSIDNIILNRQ